MRWSAVSLVGPAAPSKAQFGTQPTIGPYQPMIQGSLESLGREAVWNMAAPISWTWTAPVSIRMELWLHPRHRPGSESCVRPANGGEIPHAAA